MVTGKNKEQFEKWYPKHYDDCKYDKLGYRIFTIEYFKLLPFEMQIGVYLAFYDSLDVHVQGIYKHRDGWRYDISYKTNRYNPYKKFEGYMKCCYNMNKAYKEAFKTANSIINNTNNNT